MEPFPASLALSAFRILGLLPCQVDTSSIPFPVETQALPSLS